MYNFLLAATALVGLVSAAPTTLKAPSAVLPRQGGDFYTQYNGDGSEAAGWPSQAAWVSDLDTMFAANKAVMMASCVDGVPNNSEDETAAVKTAVQSQAAAAGLDERFVFAVIMQESHGCVRANTTDNGVRNPGLMQSHDGTATCNDLGVVTNPCPPEQIERMVKDGAARTAAGDGLQQTLARKYSQSWIQLSLHG